MTQDEKASVEVTARTKVRRFPPRGHYDKQTIWGILDKAIVAHVGFAKDGLPAMLPMVFFRMGDHVYFHGAHRNRMFGSFSEDPEVCFTATVIDGFVAARAALHHSMNYRSVIIYGTVEQVDDPSEKMDALKGLIERFYPNRWDKIRRPSDSEFARVSVYRLPIREASAKIRNAFPAPVPDEMDMNVWAGVVPLETRMGLPVLDANSNPDTTLQQDFSRIAEILRPSEDANKPGAPVPAYAEPGQRAAATGIASSPAACDPAPESASAGAAETSMVGVTFTLADGSRQDVDAKVGQTVMEAATAAGVPGIVAECGGAMACATCPVYVDADWISRVPPPAAGEGSMLDFVEGGRQAGSRLSCQIAITPELEGFHAVVPPGQR